jgi:hypothetical protein
VSLSSTSQRCGSVTSKTALVLSQRVASRGESFETNEPQFWPENSIKHANDRPAGPPQGFGSSVDQQSISETSGRRLPVTRSHGRVLWRRGHPLSLRIESCLEEELTTSDRVFQPTCYHGHLVAGAVMFADPVRAFWLFTSMNTSNTRLCLIHCLSFTFY